MLLILSTFANLVLSFSPSLAFAFLIQGRFGPMLT